MPQNKPRKKLAYKKLNEVKKNRSMVQKYGVRNVFGVSGLLIGAIAGFIYALSYFGKIYKVSSILQHLMKDVSIFILWGCLAGGIAGFLIGFMIEKYKIKKA